MRIIVRDTAVEAAEHAADLVVDSAGGVLGLATGSSPQPLYAALAARVADGSVDFGRTRGFALDEYVGLDPAHPESYHSIIARDVIGPLGFSPSRVFVPAGSGTLDEVDARALDYDAAIAAAGGVDVQILGIGSNGHIGFNEPGSAADSVTRRVDLAPSTIAANSRFFRSAGEVPVQAVTQGISTILRARSIVLVASGAAKARAVRAAVEGPVGESCPASFLRLHDEVTLCLDSAAASQLGVGLRSGAGVGA
ncbi:glucosamine-6-phosphate deaminase [Frondihabitans australicus]|uniref:Glucosamine-6-phosphate deaminase n=1 Tax=Frondihabitans australicus TaxID=386892 RepID=A0A495IH11_9MICO|nr:glucosamine-6-phosphate deaminase [Frondihabitans australicus]RKR75267.1 glucosamine-6-phosphate deaminase [Frondihabitans australicus]